jgi:glycosyltransferase involved in cell wall biosynthesis
LDAGRNYEDEWAWRLNGRLMVKIAMIVAALPPKLDGIGDYTAHLAHELARSSKVTILTGQAGADPIGDVVVKKALNVAVPSEIAPLANALEEVAPDWIVLQWNPFSYGKRGWNPYLPQCLRKYISARPKARLAVMVHEPYAAGNGWRSAVLSTWQRWHLSSLAKTATILFFSTDPWTRRFEAVFPNRTVRHLPVSSNIPYVATDKQDARAGLGIPGTAVVLGLFGNMGAGRKIDGLVETARVMKEQGRELCILHVGAEGAAVRESLPGVPVRDLGALPARAVSQAFAAMDILVLPFVDGISTRRTSLMTGLQHGLPIVGTRGASTDPELLAEHGRSFLLSEVGSPNDFAGNVKRLVKDPALATRLGAAGRTFFERNYSWRVIGGQLIAALEA